MRPFTARARPAATALRCHGAHTAGSSRRARAPKQLGASAPPHMSKQSVLRVRRWRRKVGGTEGGRGTLSFISWAHGPSKALATWAMRGSSQIAKSRRNLGARAWGDGAAACSAFSPPAHRRRGVHVLPRWPRGQCAAAELCAPPSQECRAHTATRSTRSTLRHGALSPRPARLHAAQVLQLRHAVGVLAAVRIAETDLRRAGCSWAALAQAAAPPYSGMHAAQPVFDRFLKQK